MEHLHGARPKWNQAGRPKVVPEEPRGMDVESTGGMGDLDVEEHGAPDPPLSLPRQNMQEAGVVTPPRRGVDEHGGPLGCWVSFASKGDTSSSPDLYGSSG